MKIVMLQLNEKKSKENQARLINGQGGVWCVWRGGGGGGLENSTIFMDVIYISLRDKKL